MNTTCSGNHEGTRLSSLPPDAITEITNRLDTPGLVSLWATGDGAMQATLAANVARFAMWPVKGIRFGLVAMMATRFRNLREFDAYVGNYQPALLRWSEMSPTLRSVSLESHELVQSLFQGWSQPHNSTTLLPQLSKLELRSTGTGEYIQHAALPRGLTELVLSDTWEKYPFGHAAFSLDILPPHLTSLDMMLEKIEFGVWPTTLTKLKLNMEETDEDLTRWFGELPRSLVHFEIEASSQVRIKVELISALPPSLTHLVLSSFDLWTEPVQAVYAALPRSLRYFELDESFFISDPDTFAALPRTLIVLKMGDVISPSPASAAKLPRSLTEFGTALIDPYDFKCLPHLPPGLRLLEIGHDVTLSSSTSFYEGCYSHLRRFTNLEGLSITDKSRHMKLDDVMPGDMFMLKLPETLKTLQIQKCISNLSCGRGNPDVVNVRLPRSLTTLHVLVVDVPVAWWSALPDTLRIIDLTVGVFGFDEFVALASACPGLNHIVVSVSRTANFGDMEAFVAATPKSAEFLHISLGRHATINVDRKVALHPKQAALSFNPQILAGHRRLHTFQILSAGHSCAVSHALPTMKWHGLSILCNQGETWGGKPA